ncbi:MAG: M56 family metallopeptidase [bacterium]
MSGVGPFALVATLWLSGAAGVALLCHALWPLFERRTRSWPQRRRARWLGLLAGLPAGLPTLLLALCVAPGTVGLLTGRGDHCPAHREHAHLCLVHDSIALSPVLVLGLLVATTLLLGASRSALRWLSRSRQEDRLLSARADGRTLSGARLTRSGAPFAATGGSIRTRIWLSTALFEALSPAQREVVVAHERAHAERRDPLRAIVASILARLHVPSTRHALLAALRLAAEQACDERAASAVGDRLQVAETLLHVERLVQDHARHAPRLEACAALAGSTLPPRVRSLMREEVVEPPEPSLLRLVLIGSILAVVGASPLHHLAEHVLEAVTGWLASVA